MLLNLKPTDIWTKILTICNCVSVYYFVIHMIQTFKLHNKTYFSSSTSDSKNYILRIHYISILDKLPPNNLAILNI